MKDSDLAGGQIQVKNDLLKADKINIKFLSKFQLVIMLHC